MKQDPILKLQKISKKYSRQGIPAVKEVSLSLPQGHLLSLLGPSGCGKTTLLRLIAGFEQPLQGEITIAGTVVANTGFYLPPEKRDVGMVFQDYALFPHLNVGKNIAFGLKQNRSLSGTEIKKQVQAALDLVGLDGLENRYPHELSGGQQQRVALARALAPRPNLVLLDEPLSNLDVQVRLRLRTELRDILKAAGIAAVFVTHDQEEALSISDSVAVMQQGSIEQHETPEQVYLSPASRFVAEFVTQGNFLPASRNGKGWETEIGTFALDASQVSDAVGGDSGELMIRQEDMSLTPDESSEIVILDREFLGREHRYRLQLPSGMQLKVRTHQTPPLVPKTAVKLTIEEGMLQLFSSGSTLNRERLTAIH
ncbi:ABC transporter ATP-binding protein [Dactylococcopsis salina]|uniref:ABC-type quaternary amine transporter n=1 Tax=Dactylococcopsis salina (strain PCC 8305) TaxID=13035 RepID=K9YTB3_DACS8|nr:ABC transporter ATP-binding protein [Dactylococcopsis salina]AFZ49348.1 ABC-type spermidine/putrescine transport system, ATPase component [Dactylococcopsis salina PCC 8305]